jgi:glyoxylase-like metal-dependent hydrolase (beta-lactamase superfamily II)/ferredoxin
MANPAERLAANAPGPLFVDRTCIDCDACRQLAPATFADAGGRSSVRTQPATQAALAAALRALVACPVGAIGDEKHHPLKDAIAAFPLKIDGPVSYLGFNAKASYGANSYLLERASGNWMIDAPRWNAALAQALEARGGVKTIFLTHRDDVADAARYAAHFNADRIIHQVEQSAMPGAEILINGEAPVTFGDITIIPTPGHTQGHCVLHAGNYLFSGDHLAWNPATQSLDAHRNVCWYSWATQLESVARLRDVDFTWLLPGHGDRVHLAAGAMKAALEALLASASLAGRSS